MVSIPTVRLLVVGMSALPFVLYQLLKTRYTVEVGSLKKNFLAALATHHYSVFCVWAERLPHWTVQKIVLNVRERFPLLPIVILGSLYSSQQHAQLLEKGATDCVSRAASVEEVIAKTSILTQHNINNSAESIFKKGAFEFHFVRNQATYRNIPLPLNRKELRLLNALLRRKNTIISHALLYDLVWDRPNTLSSNSLEVYMSSLRRKIEKPFGLKLFETIKGVGYRVKEL